MKASELIIKLQEAISEHGDLPVLAHDGLDPSDICEVESYDIGETTYPRGTNGIVLIS